MCIFNKTVAVAAFNYFLKIHHNSIEKKTFFYHQFKINLIHVYFSFILKNVVKI